MLPVTNVTTISADCLADNASPSTSVPFLLPLSCASLVGLSGLFPVLVITFSSSSSSSSRNDDDIKISRRLLGFACGGLLGDVFLHLIPDAYDRMGPGQDNGSVGTFVLLGVLVFGFAEKLAAGCLFGVAGDAGMKSAGRMNLLANCVDNFGHGLAVGGAFLVDVRTGFATTACLLCHEIPHEREKQEEKAAKKAGKRTSCKTKQGNSNSGSGSGSSSSYLNSIVKMKCDDCGEDISGTYFQQDGKNICEKDYEKKYRKKCSVCGEGISGSYYTDTDGKIICQKDYKERQGGNLSCGVCGREVSTGEIVRAVDRLFHPDCFVCCVCGKSLAGPDGSNSDDQKNVYCKQDYNQKFAPRCSGCDQPIAPSPGEKTASRLKAFDKDWHPECFKCADCSSRLGGAEGKSCYPMNQIPLCLDCHKGRL